MLDAVRVLGLEVCTSPEVAPYFLAVANLAEGIINNKSYCILCGFIVKLVFSFNQLSTSDVFFGRQLLQ